MKYIVRCVIFLFFLIGSFFHSCHKEVAAPARTVHVSDLSLSSKWTMANLHVWKDYIHEEVGPDSSVQLDPIKLDRTLGISRTIMWAEEVLRE